MNPIIQDFRNQNEKEMRRGEAKFLLSRKKLFLYLLVSSLAQPFLLAEGSAFNRQARQFFSLNPGSYGSWTAQKCVICPSFSLSLPLRSTPDSSAQKIPLKKKWGRALLEFSATIAPVQIAYWTRHKFLEDYDFKLTCRDQYIRLFTFQATRFDSNSFTTNWQHVVSGALYYQSPRTNNLTLAESFLFNLGTTFYWEYLVEWREIISINDNVASAFGGTSFGEAYYQLTKYFCEQDGLLYGILGFMNPYLKLNRWLDRKALRTAPPGPTPGWREFIFHLGARGYHSTVQSGTWAAFHIGLHTKIMHIPEYGKPGRVVRKVKDTQFSEISVGVTLGRQLTEEVSLFNRVAAFGRFEQDIDETGWGSSRFFGLGSAVTYFRKHKAVFYDSSKIRVKLDPVPEPDEPRKFKDKFFIVHVLGPVFDYTRFGRGFKLRYLQEFYLDFAHINALAYNRYSENHSILGNKTTLLYYGYYYGIGPTISSSLTGNYGNLEFEGRLKYHLSHSIEGRDRFQDDITDDFHIRDSRLLWHLGLGYRISGLPLELKASYEGTDRRGKIKGIKVREGEMRLFAGLAFIF